MRKILSLVLCAALLLTLPACAAKPEEPENPYRISSILQEYMDDSGNVNSIQHYDMTYNNAGQLIKQIITTDGVQTDEEIREHDEYGNIIRITKTTNESTQVTENQLTLDEAHRPLRIESYQEETLFSVEEFTYDKNGNVIFNMLTRWETDDTPDVFKNEYTYDHHGNMTERIWTYNGSVYRWTYTDGKPTHRLHTTESGETQDYTVYEYNDRGQEIKWTDYSPGGKVTRTRETTYDQTGLTATAQTYHGGVVSESRDITTYDEYGNTLSLLKQKKNGTEWQTYWRITYTYEAIPDIPEK